MFCRCHNASCWQQQLSFAEWNHWCIRCGTESCSLVRFVENVRQLSKYFKPLLGISWMRSSWQKSRKVPREVYHQRYTPGSLIGSFPSLGFNSGTQVSPCRDTQVPATNSSLVEATQSTWIVWCDAKIVQVVWPVQYYTSLDVFCGLPRLLLVGLGGLYIMAGRGCVSSVQSTGGLGKSLTLVVSNPGMLLSEICLKKEGLPGGISPSTYLVLWPNLLVSEMHCGQDNSLHIALPELNTKPLLSIPSCIDKAAAVC
jgi:hypothetical protein